MLNQPIILGCKLPKSVPRTTHTTRAAFKFSCSSGSIDCNYTRCSGKGTGRGRQTSPGRGTATGGNRRSSSKGGSHLQSLQSWTWHIWCNKCYSNNRLLSSIVWDWIVYQKIIWRPLFRNICWGTQLLLGHFTGAGQLWGSSTFHFDKGLLETLNWHFLPNLPWLIPFWKSEALHWVPRNFDYFLHSTTFLHPLFSRVFLFEPCFTPSLRLLLHPPRFWLLSGSSYPHIHCKYLKFIQFCWCFWLNSLK